MPQWFCASACTAEDGMWSGKHSRICAALLLSPTQHQLSYYRVRRESTHHPWIPLRIGAHSSTAQDVLLLHCSNHAREPELVEREHDLFPFGFQVRSSRSYRLFAVSVTIRRPLLSGRHLKVPKRRPWKNGSDFQHLRSQGRFSKANAEACFWLTELSSRSA